MKTTNKLGYKVLIFNFVSLAIAGGLIGSGIALGIDDAIGYGVAVTLMPLLTLRIKAGVSVKRNFVGIAIYSLGIIVFALFHFANIMQIKEITQYAYWGLSCLVIAPVGIWVALKINFQPFFNLFKIEWVERSSCEQQDYWKKNAYRDSLGTDFMANSIAD